MGAGDGGDWVIGDRWSVIGGKGKGVCGWVQSSGADRAARVTRDTGPSAAFSGIAAHSYAAATPTPCGRTSLTHSRVGPPGADNPIRATGSTIARGAMDSEWQSFGRDTRDAGSTFAPGAMEKNRS